MSTLDLLVAAKRAFTNNSGSVPFAAVMDSLTKQELIDELNDGLCISTDVLTELDELLIVALGSCPHGKIYILNKRDFVNIIEIEPNANWEGWFSD